MAVGHGRAACDHALVGDATPVSERAFEVAAALDAGPDPVLALAGATVGEAAPSGSLKEAVAESGVERRPGVGVPTADVADGLAHSTLLHAPFSGDPEATAAALAGCDRLAAAESGDASEADRRAIASLVAVRTTTAEGATPRAAEAVERVLRPHVGGTLATVEGYGDVLDALARERPGVGIALALSHDYVDRALDIWRDHGERVHRALRAASTDRYDGLFVARVAEAVDSPVPVGSAARLLRDFRSPEPVALVVGDGRAAAAGVDDRDVAGAMRAAAADVGGTATGHGRRGRAQFQTDTAAFVTAFREAR
ncbi:MAG: hypothetical protein ABEJ05_11370 [Haloglomus sp.]